MKSFSRIGNIVFFTLLNGCAGFGMPSIQPGEPEQAVIAKLGQPTHRYRDGAEQVLEYATGPWGQQTYMARIGPSGNLTSYEQVLTLQKFATIQAGIATKSDVLHTIGAPSETTYLPLSGLEVWSYPYKEAGAWDSMMHVHFDKAGIVRRMENGPDPSRDPEHRWRLGMRGR